MRRILLLCAIAGAASAAPADAWWAGAGAGSGSGAAATMPAGATPSVTTAGRDVSLAWTQSTFAGAPLGSYPGGGYEVTRYAPGGSTAQGGCAGAISGSAAALGCSEGSVPWGPWEYAVKPVLGSFTGEQSARTAASVLPAVPAGFTATAAAGARIDLSWSAVAAADGYNVYRRTGAGAFDFGSPLNGATPLTATTFADTAAVNGTSYRYVVRAVGITGGTSYESASSTESAAVTADGTAPPAPSALSVTGGGNLLAATTCTTFLAGTRFINNAGKAAVPVTATIATVEAGQTLVLEASTPGSTPVTTSVAAAGTSVSASLNLTSLLDGVVTLTARSRDAAGNLSAPAAPTNAVRKDVVVAALSGLSYNDRAVLSDQILGTSECGASATAVRTVPSAATYGPLTVGAGGTFTLNVAAATLTAYSYNVTATDLAGNASAVSVVAGNAIL